jgi:hypothetical protein
VKHGGKSTVLVEGSYAKAYCARTAHNKAAKAEAAK